MGEGSSKLTEDQLKEVRSLIQKWANDQDNQTNNVMRSQYSRVTELINQVSQRLTNRQDASQERLERQVNELKEQLEHMQKKMKSNDEAGSSGNRINDILNNLQGLIGSSLSEIGGNGPDGFQQKMPNQAFMNYSSPFFGPAAMHHGYEGPQFGHPAFQSSYGPNPNMPPHSAHPFQQNYQPPHFPSQQPYAPTGPHPGNPYPTQHSPSAPEREHPLKKPAKAPMGKSDSAAKSGGPSKVRSQEVNLSMPGLQNVNKEAKKSNDPNIISITKRFAESRKDVPKNSQKIESVNLKDIQDIVAKFKQQQIESEKEKSSTNVKFNKKKSQNTNAQRKEDDTKSNPGNDSYEKGYNRWRTNKNDDRRGQFKARGRGRSSHQQWINKNRLAKKKHNIRSFDNNESDSDSNESVASNFSCVSKASTVPAERNKKLFWTTRPEYARNYNYELCRSQVESAWKCMDLENYKNETECDGKKTLNTVSYSRSQSQGKLEEEKDENKNEPEKKEEKSAESESSRDENKNVAKASSSGNKNLKVINYPSEENAISQGVDLQKPLERPVLFIGLTETGVHHTHQPKCLADIYKLEKIYESRELISLM